jgi:hypothetical protein
LRLNRNFYSLLCVPQGRMTIHGGAELTDTIQNFLHSEWRGAKGV